MADKKIAGENCCEENVVEQENLCTITQNQEVNQLNANQQGDSCSVAVDGTSIANQLASLSNTNLQAACCSSNNQEPSVGYSVIEPDTCYPGDVFAGLRNPLNIKMDQEGNIALNGKKIDGNKLGEEIKSIVLDI